MKKCRGKDKQPRIRRTKEQIENDNRVEAINNIKSYLSQNFYLLPRELMNVANATEEDIVKFLREKAQKRLENAFNDENIAHRI